MWEKGQFGSLSGVFDDIAEPFEYEEAVEPSFKEISENIIKLSQGDQTTTTYES